MLDDLAMIRFPELVIGVAGPIGVDVDTLCDAISEALRGVEYESTAIKITDEINELPSSIRRPSRKNFHAVMNFKMDHASELCRSRRDAAFLMRVAVAAIRRERQQFISKGKGLITSLDLEILEHEEDFIGPVTPPAFHTIGATDRVAQSVAYIIRQIKRPEEVMLLRRIYGRQFILVSAYGSEQSRKTIIEDKIKKTMPLNTTANDIVQGSGVNR